jgi:RES domain-containing protein
MTAALLVTASPAAPTTHPESDRLRKAIRQVSSLDSSWVGAAYRVASVARSNEADLLSGEGSRIWGARWNPPGSFRTVYLSLEHLTQAIGRLAWSEGYEAILVPSAARLLSSNIVVFADKLSPRQILPINVDKLPKK